MYKVFIWNKAFTNCVFYFNNSNSLFNILELFHKDVLSKISDNNIIIKNSYIEHLAQQYNYNLDKVSNKLLCGISINNTDLSKYTLPSNPLFFQHIATKDMCWKKRGFEGRVYLDKSVLLIEIPQRSLLETLSKL